MGGVWSLVAGALAAAVVGCSATVALVPRDVAGVAVGGPRTEGESGLLPVARDGVPPRPFPTPRAPAPPRELTIVAGGDVLIHTPVAAAAAGFGAAAGLAYDFRPQLEGIRPVVEAADLALCHLEVPLSRTAVSGYPSFAAPAEVADALAWTGFDGCSTASNHSIDQGVDGLATTLDELDRVGVRHAGTARDAEEAAAPTLHHAGDVVIAHLSATYGLNGMTLPPDRPWAVTMLDVPELRRQAEAARGAGAEVVVASLHWGTEYQREPTGEQQTVAAELLGDGSVDVVLGHHAHVVQPVGWVGERPVVYGMGNLLSAQSAACCGAGTEDGVVVSVTVTEAEPDEFRATAVTYTPTWVDRADGYRVVDVGAALDGDPADPRRAELQASWDRTVAAVGEDGASATTRETAPPR